MNNKILLLIFFLSTSESGKYAAPMAENKNTDTEAGQRIISWPEIHVDIFTFATALRYAPIAYHFDRLRWITRIYSIVFLPTFGLEIETTFVVAFFSLFLAVERERGKVELLEKYLCTYRKVLYG